MQTTDLGDPRLFVQSGEILVALPKHLFGFPTQEGTVYLARLPSGVLLKEFQDAGEEKPATEFRRRHHVLVLGCTLMQDLESGEGLPIDQVHLELEFRSHDAFKPPTVLGL